MTASLIVECTYVYMFYLYLAEELEVAFGNTHKNSEEEIKDN